MSFYSMLVSQHLNQNDAGKPVLLELPPSRENMTAAFRAKKTAFILICMGFGLAKFKGGRS